MSTNEPVTTKGVEIIAKIEQTERPKYQITEFARLHPLPNGRPIAANTSVGIDGLLGYLD